jgi:molybdopterin-guanine dinucleotide biosynthesis protein A
VIGYGRCGCATSAAGLIRRGIRKVDVWTARYRLATVPFPDHAPGLGPAIDPFFNANRPEDLDRAAALLQRLEL